MSSEREKMWCEKINSSLKKSGVDYFTRLRDFELAGVDAFYFNYASLGGVDFHDIIISDTINNDKAKACVVVVYDSSGCHINIKEYHGWFPSPKILTNIQRDFLIEKFEKEIIDMFFG